MAGGGGWILQISQWKCSPHFPKVKFLLTKCYRSFQRSSQDKKALFNQRKATQLAGQICGIQLSGHLPAPFLHAFFLLKNSPSRICTGAVDSQEIISLHQTQDAGQAVIRFWSTAQFTPAPSSSMRQPEPFLWLLAKHWQSRDWLCRILRNAADSHAKAKKCLSCNQLWTQRFPPLRWANSMFLFAGGASFEDNINTKR